MRHTHFMAAAASEAILVLAVPASAGTVLFFDFLLDGSQEVPSNTSESFGFVTLEYSASEQTFDLLLFTDGIALGDLAGAGPNNTPIHLHLAPAGSNGGIVIDLGLVGSFADEGGGILSFEVFDVPIGGPQGDVPDSDPMVNEAALFAGDLYLNIHTSDFPGGEIRGQVVPSPPTLLAAGGLCVFAGRPRRRSV